MPALKLCKCCGMGYKPVFTGGAPSAYCGIKCAEVVERASKRIEKAKRKAVLRGATVECVDPFKVFDRDKWRCRLCGVRTPKGKRGTYADDAPELDHINPLAKGGEHSYINTQCSCRRCNGLKSDTPRGQMLMFG
ncbi:MAG: HNH endonuclease [Polaromonas sp.]|nr:HNH endonuclease [Polaromonas sp.]